MKKTILFLAGLGLAFSALAQSPFTCTTEGAELHYATLDAKGKESSTSVVKVKKVKSSGDTYSITQETQLYIGGQAFTSPITASSTVRNGDVVVDFSGGLSLAAEGAGFMLPKDLATGLELPTGEVTVDVQGIKVKQDITFHKVVAQESLTVPAGTYDCFVVERQYSAKMMGIKVNGIMKTWYARGIGAVKTDTYDKKGKLSTSQVLTKVVLP